MTYGSVCSGIEAASVAWGCLGWKPAWFSQYDPEHDYSRGPDFPSAVLANHWPDVPNLGDMTRLAASVRAGITPAPDLIVGGTPCQAFSVAGARAGLSDPRGQLTISYGELADAVDNSRAAEGKAPAIFVWENVPGVLSSNDNAFGAFLGLLAGEDCELQSPGKRWTNAGYVRGPKRAIAWRILDAQYFGVAQRRRRVFVVASARGDIDPTQILFESDGVRRDTPPSRSAGQVVAALTANGVGTCGADDNQGQAGHLIAVAHGQAGAEIKSDGTAPTLTCNHEAPIVFSSNSHASFAQRVGPLRAKSGAEYEILAVHGTQDPDTNVELAHTLGRNNGQENAVIAFSSKDNGQDATIELSPTIRAGNSAKSNQNAGQPPAVVLARSVSLRGHAGGATAELGGEVATCLRASTGGGDKPHVLHQMAVRRLTPVECERLQGFPDNHTLIPVSSRKKNTAEEYAYLRHHNPALTAEEAYRLAKDGPRYKAIGNSMAVPVMRWIGRRIAAALSGVNA
ncbi:TPA: DNA cytosine methyltransferase [Klebsiella aerogenes]|nr:DNA cytosine methyltransferase [Klebsiella aerogenes]